MTLALSGLAAAVVTLRVTHRKRGMRELRVVAFGLIWFFAAAAPYVVLADPCSVLVFR